MAEGEGSIITPVIIAGGKGQRLWPVSRLLEPKPFVDLEGAGKTLLQETLLRLEALDDCSAPLIVCSTAHDFLVARQSAALGLEPCLMLEPEGRNTAPAICVAALAVQRMSGPETIMLVLPADHKITDRPAFRKAVASAKELAEQNYLVTFAIRPTAPATGYGYLQLGAALNAERQQYALRAFVEKPDAVRAENFLASGNFAWNSGMFMFKASAILAAFAELEPELLQTCQQSLPQGELTTSNRLDAASFGRARNISIDYAIMEKSKNVATVLADLGWSDLGDWNAVWDALPKDAKAVSLSGNSFSQDSEASHLHSDGPLLVGFGLKDMFAVATNDAVLIAPRERAQDIRNVVEALGLKGKSEVISARKVFKPWGWYDSLLKGPGFQVKKLALYPGAKLSLQRHKFREEHWVCIAGQGRVTRGMEVFSLTVSQSIHIPLGDIHRLENDGADELHIIEVQIGPYTGEDDIERLEDIYGRA